MKSWYRLSKNDSSKQGKKGIYWLTEEKLFNSAAIFYILE